MRRSLPAVALVALVLLATAAAAATDPAAPLTYDKAIAMAKHEGKVLVIDFYADW
jgi:thiol:disulfide interchange protein